MNTEPLVGMAQDGGGEVGTAEAAGEAECLGRVARSELREQRWRSVDFDRSEVLF